MFLINPVFSLIAITVIIALYIWLGGRGLKADWGDIRGGMFLVLAERASRIAARFPRHQISWKPDLLIPINDPNVWSGSLLFIKNIVYPSGSIFAFTVKDNDIEEAEKDLSELLLPLKDQNLLVNSTIIEDNDFLHGARLVMQTLKAGAMRPNTLFLTLGKDKNKDKILDELAAQAARYDSGTIILCQHPRSAFGMQKDVNLWLRDKSPNWHLAVLITLQLQLNWEGRLNLITATEDEHDVKRLYNFLERLSDRARLPSKTDFHVLVGSFKETMQDAPNADINIFGLSDVLPFKFMRQAPELAGSSCLFVKDSGQESALV